MQVESFLEASSRRHGAKVAVVCGAARWTYAQLEQHANRLAHGLRGAGVQRGDRVAILLENSAEAVIALFAALKAGAVFMMVNPTTKADKLAYLLTNARVRSLVTDQRLLGEARAACAQSEYPAHVVALRDGAALPADFPRPLLGWEDILQSYDGQDQPPPKESIDIDLAALIYTSGSTGRPKGVMLTHLNMVTASTSISTYLGIRPDEIILTVLPMAFDYSLYQVLMAFQNGATVVIERSFTYPHATLEKVVAEQVTGLPIVPTMSSILLQMDLSKYDLSHLRYLTNTAAALPVQHVVKLRQLFPRVQLFSMYGLTECKRVAYLPPDQVDQRPGSVGKAIPNTEVYVVDERGQRVGPGVVGELVIRGAHVMQGYWENPEATEQRLKPGALPGEKVLYSGDLFRSDEEGYLYFIGRKDDIIKSRGEKVSPKEIENVLYSLEGVVEAAVIGVPDEVLGQAIKAFVVARPSSGLSVPVIRQHCARHLEDYLRPQLVELVGELPKNASGKIDKLQLK